MRTGVITIVFLIPLLSLFAIGCTGVRPRDLGVKEDKLAPCPGYPNCVSSQSSDPMHAIEPLTFSGPVAEAHAAIKQILLGMKRAAIITETGTYIHAEFTSAVFRFVDDVEFWFDENGKVVHVRSASRVGHNDLGVNRKRVEDIRARWKAKVK